MASVLSNLGDASLPLGEAPVRWPVSGGVLEVAQASPPAAIDAIAAICKLGELSPNWDSYGALPIDRQCLVTAILLWLTSARPQTPPPAVVPTIRGGVQLEWHRGGIDLEIEIRSPRQIRLSWENAVTGESSEQLLSSDFAPAVAAIETITGAA